MPHDDLHIEALLVEIRGWIEHWTEDRKGGLLPTENSLAFVRAKIDRELERMRADAGERRAA